MIKIPYDDIVAKITEATSLSNEEIEGKIKKNTFTTNEIYTIKAFGYLC